MSKKKKQPYIPLYLLDARGEIAWDKLTNAEKRSLRLRLARHKGTHTKREWEEMKAFFEYTCCCCLGESGLENIEKDHIIPLYQGGSDSITNLQPLCAKCNSAKGRINTDWRPRLAEKLGKVMPDKWLIKSEEVTHGA